MTFKDPSDQGRQRTDPHAVAEVWSPGGLYLELTRREMCERTGMSKKRLEAAIRRVRGKAGSRTS